MDNFTITIAHDLAALAFKNQNQTGLANMTDRDENNYSGPGSTDDYTGENEIFYTAIAFVFTTLGSFFTALSFTLMKYSINREQRSRTNRPAYKQTYWMTGFGLIFVSIIFNAIAMDYGNVLLLSSSSSITMIFNMLMATFFLKEYFNKKWDTLAIFLIIFGSAICASFSKNQTGDAIVTEQELFAEFSTFEAVAYISLIYSLAFFSYFFNKVIIKRLGIQHISLQQRHEEAKVQRQKMSGVQCNLAEDMMSEAPVLPVESEAVPNSMEVTVEQDDKTDNIEIVDMSEEEIQKSQEENVRPHIQSVQSSQSSQQSLSITQIPNNPQPAQEPQNAPQLRSFVTIIRALSKKQIKMIGKGLDVLLPQLNFALIIIPASAGMVASLALTLLKATTIALNTVGFGGGPSMYIYGFSALASGQLELYILNRAMNLYDQVQYIPIYQSALIFSNIMCGAIIMQESKFYSVEQFFMVILGGCLALSGIWVIVKKPIYTNENQLIKEQKQKDPLEDDLMSSSYSHIDYSTCSCEVVNINLEKQICGLSRKPLQDRVEIQQSAQKLRQIISVAYHLRQQEKKKKKVAQLKKPAYSKNKDLEKKKEAGPEPTATS